jgi:tetratricopeptide (TPR) repeat protein
VDTIIEASVLGLGEKISLQVKLVDAYPEEKQRWMQDYVEDKSQILNLYNTLTKEISNEINVLLTPEEKRLLAKSRTINRKAYEDYLKARSYVSDWSKESLSKASDYLNSAIEKEPDWAPLYAGLAELWMWIQQAGYEPPSVAAPKIYENLNKAMELDPDLAEVHYLRAMIAQLVEWDLEKSEKEFLKTLAINPNDAWSRLLYAQLLLILQRNEEALAQRELAAGLDPLNPAIKLLYSGTLVQAGEFEAGLTVAEEFVAANPKEMTANFLIEVAAYRLGEYKKVIRSMKYTLPFSIDEDVYEEITEIFRTSGIAAAYEELMVYLEQYAQNNSVCFADFAFRYIIAKQPDKAMDWIEKGYEIHDPQITYITASGRFFEQLFENPRFIAICEKAKLPLPQK